ncbi:tryptophan--tRNA ligase [Tindallia californiensis]|uniref:Tryptophan--tRNA ligase n=1 Tax=Tindallia californiensis TaxID=159292 RepID=A0A1H3IYK7_9FIRM|nr:tryptophan--tRNA ligase [Tindallia californiensis]SDY31994.1 tryptophanyl-tRNA synthetase [Tindallia californiensis]
MQNQQQKTIFSGAQPTGSMTLGNYIGALQNWKQLEKDYQCYYSIVDLHSLTVKQDPEEFRNTCLSFLAQYLASGLDTERNVIFFQSHVREHTELAWILNCYTYMGELNRMTQFKDKSERHQENINAGLFTYPVLMAADILLYQTNLVPVGEDQRQHLELSRDIAIRFNNIFGHTFAVPEIYVGKQGARIMSLQDPGKKMSKSDENQNAVIYMLDEDDVIVKKLKKAVTDSYNEIIDRPEQPGVQNLLSIYSALTRESRDKVVEYFSGKGYGALKMEVAEIIIENVKPFRTKYRQYMESPEYLETIYRSGANRARVTAAATMLEVRSKIGLINS